MMHWLHSNEKKNSALHQNLAKAFAKDWLQFRALGAEKDCPPTNLLQVKKLSADNFFPVLL